MSNIADPDTVVNSFSADAVLAAPRFRFLSLGEFIRFTFPEPDRAADRFSGLGQPDILVIKPNPAKRGKFLIVVPSNTARFLQVGSLHRADSRRIHFCVAEAGSLTPEDMEQIIEAAPDLNGLQLDVAVLTPAERDSIRRMPIRSVDVTPFLDRAEKEERRQ
jgi:hypothetical protein